MSVVKDFFLGLLLPLRAVMLVMRVPRLAILSILPICLTLLVYILLYKYLIGPGSESFAESARNFINSLPIIGSITFVAQAIGAVVGWVVQASFWILAIILFSAFSNILALPLHDYLALNTERFTKPVLPAATEGDWRTEVRRFLIDLGKSLALLPLMLICLIFSLVPVLNFVAIPVLWLLMAFQYLSFPQTRRDKSLKASLKQVAQRPAMVLGFGCSATFGFAVPVLAIVWPALAVVSGTILFAQLHAAE